MKNSRKIWMAVFVFTLCCYFGMAEIRADVQDDVKWWKRVEAESGELFGTARVERFWTKDYTVVSFLDKGEDNAVMLRVTPKQSGETKMRIRYRSMDERSLCYKVNGGEERKLTQLSSGSWDKFQLTDWQDIVLEKGENTVLFYAPQDENGPGLDYVEFSGHGGSELSGRQVKLVFELGENQDFAELVRDYSDIIYAEEIPAAPQKDGYDFLGWYWGDSAEYEVAFPLRLEDIPKEYRKERFLLRPRYGHHTPPNPVEKEGYRLIFQDEFDGLELDETKWVDRYLSSWSKTYDRTNSYVLEDGEVRLQIHENTQPWCTEYDADTVVSGFTTGQRNGLHNWTGHNEVRNPEDTRLTHINQYGYYEMRAKCQSGSARHSAWWLLGFEDVAEESAEIDIFEVMGKDDHAVPPNFHEWKDKDSKGSYFYTHRDRSKDFNNEYHVYGLDWQKGSSGNKDYPDKIVFYIDGKEVSSANINVDYPMIQLLSLYEKRSGGWTGSWEWKPYPNSFEIDYVRVYKKIPDGMNIPEGELKIESVKAHDLILEGKDVVRKSYSNGYEEKNLEGTRSYVRVLWNDGVETQEFVEWEPITDEEIETLRKGRTVIKNGYVPSISQAVTMRIGQRNYYVENLTPIWGNRDLDYTFDGLVNESGHTHSGEFYGSWLENGNAAIVYDFETEKRLKGLNIWCNYGHDQGIRKLKLAIWDGERNDWQILKDENKEDRIFVLDWKEEREEAEKVQILTEPVNTEKVKIIPLDVGYRWGKFSLREIEFLFE